MPLVPFVVIDSHLSADCDGTGGQDTLQASRGERRGEEEEEIGWSQEVCNKLDFYCQGNEENHVNVLPVHITFMLHPRSERNPRL